MNKKLFFKLAIGNAVLVTIAIVIALVTDITIAQAWAVVMVVSSGIVLSKRFPVMLQQAPKEQKTTVKVGMGVGVGILIFINIITPLAIGGLIGVGASVAMATAFAFIDES